MSHRAAELIRTLELQPHPEGGHFRELHRSSAVVEPGDGRGARAALTTIYFLLRAGEHSRLHRVESDELWHHYEGDPLELLWSPPGFDTVVRLELGPVASGLRPVEVVPAGYWQAARTTGEYTLAGCTVGPGFDFADFTLIEPTGDDASLVRRMQPTLAPFVEPAAPPR